MRLLRERTVDVGGRPAFVIGLESVGSASRLEIVTTQRTGKIVDLYEGAARQALPSRARALSPRRGVL